MKGIFERCRLWLWKYNEKKWLAHLAEINNNHDFTLISNNCMAGIIYHNLGEMFRSPTINLYIEGKEYLEYCKNFEIYSKCELYEDTEAKKAFPVGVLIPRGYKDCIPIHVYFQHYHSFEEAKEKWELRCKRINYDNLFFAWEFYDTKYDIALIQEFDKLPIKKIAILHHPIEDVENAVILSCYKNDHPMAKAFQYDGITGKRFLDEFDYIKFLNN